MNRFKPHDVRAHLLGGVPVAEVTDKRPLFDALGFNPAHAFIPRSSRGNEALTSNLKSEIQNQVSLLTSAATKQLNALHAELQPVLDQLAVFEAALVPYEAIKEKLSEARARFRTLTDEQIAIADALFAAADQIESETREAAKLSLLKSGLMTDRSPAAAACLKRWRFRREPLADGLTDT